MQNERKTHIHIKQEQLIWPDCTPLMTSITNSSGLVKVLHLRCQSQKGLKPKPKNFFSMQTTRLAESFEHFNSSIALTTPELGSHKATCKQAVFVRTASINPAPKVLK